MTPLVSVLPTNPPEQLDVILSLYSRTTGHLDLQHSESCAGYVTDADWQRVGFCRLKASRNRECEFGGQVAELKDWNGDTQTPLWCTMSGMAHLPSSVEPGGSLGSLT